MYSREDGDCKEYRIFPFSSANRSTSPWRYQPRLVVTKGTHGNCITGPLWRAVTRIYTESRVKKISRGNGCCCIDFLRSYRYRESIFGRKSKGVETRNGGGERWTTKRKETGGKDKRKRSLIRIRLSRGREMTSERSIPMKTFFLGTTPTRLPQFPPLDRHFSSYSNSRAYICFYPSWGERRGRRRRGEWRGIGK